MCKFRHLLERNGLGTRLFQEVGLAPAAKDLTQKRGRGYKYLKPRQRIINRARSRVRARVEHENIADARRVTFRSPVDVVFIVSAISSRSFSRVPPAASQSDTAPLADKPESSTIRAFVTPLRDSATRLACTRPGSSLSGMTITSAPFSHTECASVHFPAPFELHVATKPCLRSVSASFSPSTAKIGLPALIASSTRASGTAPA